MVMQMTEVFHPQLAVAETSLQSTVHYTQNRVISLQEHSQTAVGSKGHLDRLQELELDCFLSHLFKDKGQQISLLIFHCYNKCKTSLAEMFLEGMFPLIGRINFLQTHHQQLTIYSLQHSHKRFQIESTARGR